MRPNVMLSNKFLVCVKGKVFTDTGLTQGDGHILPMQYQTDCYIFIHKVSVWNVSEQSLNDTSTYNRPFSATKILGKHEIPIQQTAEKKCNIASQDS